jgi:hypothetical protein
MSENPRSNIKAGDHLHHWKIIAIDGRRVTAMCVCHQIRIVAIEDLQSGVRTSCGCMPTPRAYNRAALETHQEQRRRKNFTNWQRLERGR